AQDRHARPSGPALRPGPASLHPRGRHHHRPQDRPERGLRGRAGEDREGGQGRGLQGGPGQDLRGPGRRGPLDPRPRARPPVCYTAQPRIQAVMIISRTPFRISFAGGGTDLPAFYERHAGAVVSTAIDKYMYITVNRFFDDRIILKYSRTELVSRVEE